MKHFFTLLAYLICFSIQSQTTYINGVWSDADSEGEQRGRLKSVEIRDDGVIVTIEIEALKKLKRLNIYSSPMTYIVDSNKTKLLGLDGFLNNGVLCNEHSKGTWGWDKVPKGAIKSVQFFFGGKLPPGLTEIGIIDFGDIIYNTHGYCFGPNTIINPRKNYLPFYTEQEIKNNITQNNDGICGIYEPIYDYNEALACVKYQNKHYLIHLRSSENKHDLYRSWWQIGDIIATIKETASGLIKANWQDRNKYEQPQTYFLTFDGISMVATRKNNNQTYLKTFPTEVQKIGSDINIEHIEEWSGTGFALNDGYIATNYHVVENAKSINIYGINGDFTTQYNATVVATDKYNDIALLQITDEKFDGFGVIPYNVKTAVSDVGENIFVLGYPLTSTMGDEIKLTTGVVSSKTGFQGDVSIYQISAPIQPGNSGGPLFDNNGNLIGIVNAKHNEAENVGYAIKTSYLQNLIESSISSPILPYNKQLANLALTEKIKRLKNFVFMIKCSNLNNNNKVHKSTSYTNNIIEHPLVGVTTAKRAKIKSVTLSQDYTAIEITSNNLSETDNSYYTWVMIDKDTYILANGKRYTMTRADGIKIAPEKTYYSYAGQDITFTLYFPPIPETTSIDLIEPGYSDWKFYNISLK